MSVIIDEPNFLDENLTAARKDANTEIAKFFLKKLAINVGIVLTVHVVTNYALKKLNENDQTEIAE